ncbi:hypothetical protein MTO96_015355 [Rhipicephalus appendiculatus]
MRKAITEVAAYVAASDDTCKGVIRGINPDITEAELTDMIVNRRNPRDLGVRRIKKTPTAIVLLDGLNSHNMYCAMVSATPALYTADKWTSATRAETWATGQMFVQKVKHREGVEVAAP